MSDKPKTQEELKEILGSFDKKFQELKADMPAQNDQMNKMLDYCYSMVSSLRNYVYGAEDRMHNRMSDHEVGHAPKFKTNAQLQAFLENHDMEADYQTKPQNVSAAKYSYNVVASKDGVVAELNIKKNE